MQNAARSALARPTFASLFGVVSVSAFVCVASVGALVAHADEHPMGPPAMSPPGSAAAQVLGKWSTADRPRYENGKWIVVDYGRPLLRGRKDIFGAGPDYGKKVNAGAPVWRVGANQTTRIKTETPITVGGKKLAAGEYDLFVELKEGGWTLIVSTQPTADKYVPGSKDNKMWGSYGYDPKFDLVRAPMKMGKSDASIEQLTIELVDVSDKAATLRMSWDHTMASVPLAIGE